MSQAVLRIPTPLRSFTGGVDELRVEGRNVRELLRQLAQQHPGLEPRLFDDSGPADSP